MSSSLYVFNPLETSPIPIVSDVKKMLAVFILFCSFFMLTDRVLPTSPANSPEKEVGFIDLCQCESLFCFDFDVLTLSYLDQSIYFEGYTIHSGFPDTLRVFLVE